MDMYQHDGVEMFEFVLRGELSGDGVQNLEHAWILRGRFLPEGCLSSTSLASRMQIPRVLTCFLACGRQGPA